MVDADGAAGVDVVVVADAVRQNTLIIGVFKLIDTILIYFSFISIFMTSNRIKKWISIFCTYDLLWLQTIVAV